MFVIPVTLMGSTRGALTLAKTASALNTSTSTTQTFTSLAVGAASSDRLVLVSVAAVGGNTTIATPTSVTIGGVTATAVTATATLSIIAGYALSWYKALVPSGTTATVVANFSGSGATSCAVEVYTLKNYSSSTPFHTNKNTSTGTGACSTTLNTPAGGIAIGAVMETNSATVTWVGLTEDSDPGVANRTSSASQTGLSAQTGRTVSSTPSVTTGQLLSVASFS